MSSAVRSYCPNCLHAFEGSPERCQNLACRRIRPRSGWLRLLAEGDILDRNFLIQSLIAVGGAGVTYQAQEIGAGGIPQPPVLAIKVLHSRRARGSFLQRLTNEARILQNLRHDHIVECLGFSQRKGAAPYLVTRFEKGGTLEEWAREHGPLPGWTVAGILRQIFEGLTAAHQKGVVHRDLKPANLLLAHRTQPTQIPHVRIADFGIAKITGKLNEGLTRVGAFIGTPRYAAPEQFAGAPATAATDVFAGGVLAYELLTAEPLMQEPDGGDLEDWRDAMVAALPPTLPSALRDDPRSVLLEALLEGTLQADPAARWDAAHVIAYLDHVLGIRAEPPVWRAPPTHDEGAAAPDPGPGDDTRATRAGPPVHQDATDSTEDGGTHGHPQAPAVGDVPTLRRDEAITELGTRSASPVSPRTAPPASPHRAPRTIKAPLHNETSSTRPAKRPEATVSETPRPPRPRSTDRPAAPPPRPKRRAASSTLVPRRDAAEVLGNHPDASWVTEATLDQSGGADLDRLVPTASSASAGPEPKAGRSPHTEWHRPPLTRVAVASTSLPVWEPVPPFPLPSRLPGPPTELLCLLASVAGDDRARVARALAGTSPTELDRCIRDHRPGGDPLVGRGVGLAISVLRRREWEPAARGLLSDPDVGVRVAAATALGSVGEEVRSLDRLQTLLADPHPGVRVAAVRALAAVALQTGRERVAAFAIKPLAGDPAPGLLDAVEWALADLE